MRRIKIAVLLIVLLVFACQVPARADTVELDLFSLGCQHTYDINLPSWQTNFNLGVTFSQISNVYINWSGTIVAEKVCPSATLETTFPVNGKFVVRLSGANAYYIPAGAATYPNPESFGLQSQLYETSYESDEILVRFADANTTKVQRNGILASYGGGIVTSSFDKIIPGLSLVSLPQNATVEEVITALSGAPEILDSQPNYIYHFIPGPLPWSGLLDGQGSIEIWFGKIYRSPDLCTVEYPIGQLDTATLMIEGTVIPEPATTLLLLVFGIAICKRR